MGAIGGASHYDHGDYDVDSITSTVILRRALELLGADVGIFIRNAKDGYGLQPAAIERLHADGVAWSCRSTAAFAAPTRAHARAARRRSDRHGHASRTRVPPALAVISEAPRAAIRTMLAGVGVALKPVTRCASARIAPRGCPASSRSPRSGRWPVWSRSSARTRHRQARSRSADARTALASACVRSSTFRA